MMACDAKLNFDDNAEWRQKETFQFRDYTQEDSREVRGEERQRQRPLPSSFGLAFCCRCCSSSFACFVALLVLLPAGARMWCFARAAQTNRS